MNTWPLPELLPERWSVNGLTLIPLTPELVEPDYAAVMRDITMLRAWSGEDWPYEGFPIADNLADLQRHDREQHERSALTYSVLIDDVVQGCIYVRPLADALRSRHVDPSELSVAPPADAVVGGWLHDRPAEDLVAATVDWLSAEPFVFTRVWWQTNSQDPAQVLACAQLGLTEQRSFAGDGRTWTLCSRVQR